MGGVLHELLAICVYWSVSVPVLPRLPASIVPDPGGGGWGSLSTDIHPTLSQNVEADPGRHSSLTDQNEESG